MGCTASKHLGRHFSMDQCPSPSMTPECTGTYTTEYTVECHQHIVALTSSSYGLLKFAQPSEPTNSSNHGIGGVVSLNDMYNKLISLDMTEPVNLQASRNMLHSALGSETSSHPEWRIDSAKSVISETIDVRELMLGFEDKATPQGVSYAGNSSLAITKTPTVQRDTPVLRKGLHKPFHTLDEADIWKMPSKVIQHRLDEDDYEFGKENNGPEHDVHDIAARCSSGSSPLSQISQPALGRRHAKEKGILSSVKCSPKDSRFAAISEAKRNTMFKHEQTQPAQLTQQQRRKFASSVAPLSVSMSRRVIVKENIQSTELSSPVFDPDIVSAYEEALRNISEDSWNACLVDSPAVDSHRASHNEPRAAIGSHGQLITPRGIGFHDALDRFANKCPPDGDEKVVLYTTTLRGIRKTYEDCNKVRKFLQSHALSIDERDVSMHLGFLNELRGLMDRMVSVPRLFVKGRYIGGVEEVSKLHEGGKLNELVEGLPRVVNRGKCEGCDGVRFVPCLECSGSCKIRREDRNVVRCPDCNENGLIKCPICT